MSLLVWLPLNGNLENQGLSNATVTNNGATVDNNGKIGKCYSFNGSSNYFILNKSPNNLFSTDGHSFSFSIWVYSATTQTERTGLICSNAYQISGIGIGLTTDNKLTFQYNWSGGTYEAVTDAKLTNGAWSHVVMCYDMTTKKGYIYLNGEKKYERDCPVNWLRNSTKFTIGKNTQGGWPGYFNGKMNDIRIYDHCLSPKEVKELAKGLVLHYRLAGPGQENLVPNSDYNNYTTTPTSSGVSLDYSVLWNGMPTLKLSQSGNTSNVYRGFGVNILNSLTKGEKYTMTVYAYTKDKSLLDSGMEVRIYQQRANGASTLWGNLSYSLINNSWVKIQGTYTIDTNATNAIVNMQIIKNGTVWFSPVKVEKGSVATPWVPNPSDALYRAMGYNNNIEYDCAGYQRNGTKSGNIIWDIDTPRHTTSYKFDGSTAGIEVTATGLGNIMNNPCTIAFWLYSNDKGGRSIYFSAYNSKNTSWSIEKTNDERFRYYWNGSPDRYSTGVMIPDKKWTHICFVREGISLAKLYLDGNLKYSFTDTTSSLSLGDTWRIGRDVRTGDGTPLNGNMSDFRIYATVLSAEDIAELYHTSGWVDSKTAAAYEFKED